MDRMEFTGSRIEDYEALQDLLRSRIITKRDYNTELGKLKRKQAGIDKRSEIAERKRAEKRQQKHELRKQSVR